MLAVSSPLLASMAIGEKVERRRARRLAPARGDHRFRRSVVDTDEEALAAIRTFLSYMPPRQRGAARARRCRRDRATGCARSFSLLPAEPHAGLRRAQASIRAIVDKGSLFELKARFGKVAVTGARPARRDDASASSPTIRCVKGGALDTDACEKITSFLVLCDTFNIPLVMFVDTPGFADRHRSRAKARARQDHELHARAADVHRAASISVILRKSYGQAYLNMGGGRNSDEVAAWPTAEVSFMDPTFAVKIVHGLAPGEPGFDAAFAQMNKDSEPLGHRRHVRGADRHRAEHDARLPDPHARRAYGCA